jgi:DnaJ-class molecular chaperone
MAKRTKVECTWCYGHGITLMEDYFSTETCHRCHGRGYVYSRPVTWRCPVCDRLTQGLKACGHCRCEKPRDA